MQFGAQGFKCVHRIRNSITLQFTWIHDQSRLAAQGQFQHFQASRRRGDGWFAMRRPERRHEAHLRQIRAVDERAGEMQVPVVHRIETSA